jgi:hypothetical protein
MIAMTRLQRLATGNTFHHRSQLAFNRRPFNPLLEVTPELTF